MGKFGNAFPLTDKGTQSLWVKVEKDTGKTVISFFPLQLLTYSCFFL